ncbi:hypothetical protein A8F94_18480 [Bacillus sp. FJAT-27225]|uniref:YczE/YyaS/YitT family protein n=1 Tax=Bacillus sp. FJAT-27225 TaxID=1743144 RepID=UPI00080C2188|nr:DUF6198 family protein [Bacillus sp. FJAT-27225]OCA83116.1 hypothetical protein A8F94_18480 [Bacillus sp. FJAT-27225]
MAIFYRILFFIIGLMILTFGVSLTIVANVGAGAWDALNVGLSKTFGLTVGNWVMIVAAILMVINAFLHRRKPELLAVLLLFTVGPMIDVWMLYVLNGWSPDAYMAKMIGFLLGLVIIGFGAAIYLQAKFPLLPIDNFMMGIKKRFNLNITAAKTATELFALVLALLAGGPIGVGTLIVTFAIGPIINFFFPPFERLFQKMLASTELKKEQF